MLPIPESLLGAAFSLASRAARGEIDVDEQTRERLQRVRTSLEEVSELVGDLSARDPSSWAAFAGRAMDRTCETHGRAESTSEWRKARGFVTTLALDGVVVDYLRAAEDVATETVFTDGDEAVLLADLPNGTPLAVETTGAGTGSTTGLYHRPGTSRRAVHAGLAAAFWSRGPSVRIAWGGSAPILRRIDLDRFEYRGDRRELIARWRRFLEAGIPRKILLQGAPGTGKTTLCCHAAREIGGRTLVVTGDVLDQQPTAAWNQLFEILAPTVVIVDDVERPSSIGGEGISGDRLRLFGSECDEIPLVLFTSNDHAELPEAMRRPGRIDRIVEFEENASETRRQIVRQIAGEEGVAIPEGRFGELEELISEYGAAHVREALRRAEVLGWEQVSFDVRTFRMHSDCSALSEWLRVHGFERLGEVPDTFADELFGRSEVERVMENERGALESRSLPRRAVIWRRADAGGGFGVELHVRGGGAGREAIRREAAAVFWEGRSAVILDAIDREFTFRSVDLETRSYVGPHLDLIDQLRAFREAGMRRSVLLQGPPGTGKSTLCLHAARRLVDRSLFLSPDALGELRAAEWEALTWLFAPEMVIVDDVDRVGHGRLECKLRFFEDRYCEIPFVLFTSNDAGELPAPMKRPGRIDQIIEIEPPDRPRRRRLIGVLAERIGVEVPERYLERLDAVYREQSPAHVRELLRRAKALGWERLDALPGDRTFDPAFAETDDRDARDEKRSANRTRVRAR